MGIQHEHELDAALPADAGADPRFRRVLWIALIVNGTMFLVEVAGGVASGSVSLLADALDFFGDAVNYGLSLIVLSMALVWRARLALAKGLAMGAYGLSVLARALWSAWAGVVPEPATMGVIGLLALLANLSVAYLLFAYRGGDANMRSVWLCSRNDAIGNLAILLAAVGVFGTGTAWPDLAVAVVMAGLGISASLTVVGHAAAELRAAR